MTTPDAPQVPETPWQKLTRLAHAKTGQKGYSGVAALLGLTPQAVRLWNKVVPLAHCKKLIFLLDGEITMQELHPELFQAEAAE